MVNPTYFLDGLINNNETIVREIYQKSFQNVLSFVLKNKGQQEDAEDVFQKALLQIAVRYKKEKFEIKNSFESYLFVVCRNLWRRELNKHKNKVTFEGLGELEDDKDDIALSILEQKRWELFNDCLNQISENCKQILKHYFAKIPYAKIAEQLNYNSENVVRQRVFKCKNKLKELVNKDKRFSSLTKL